MKSLGEKMHSSKTCPVAQVAELVGDTCTLLIVRDLLSGAKRFTELSESISTTSSRTLTKKLRELEEKGVITRTEYKESPPRVMYTLTPKGRGLDGIYKALRKYGEKYL